MLPRYRHEEVLWYRVLWCCGGEGVLSPPHKNISFEGVSVTTVILAPGACGLGLRAALLATTSPPPAAPVATA